MIPGMSETNKQKSKLNRVLNSCLELYKSNFRHFSLSTLNTIFSHLSLIVWNQFVKLLNRGQQTTAHLPCEHGLQDYSKVPPTAHLSCEHGLLDYSKAPPIYTLPVATFVLQTPLHGHLWQRPFDLQNWKYLSLHCLLLWTKTKCNSILRLPVGSCFPTSVRHAVKANALGLWAVKPFCWP